MTIMGHRSTPWESLIAWRAECSELGCTEVAPSGATSAEAEALAEKEGWAKTGGKWRCPKHQGQGKGKRKER